MMLKVQKIEKNKPGYIKIKEEIVQTKLAVCKLTSQILNLFFKNNKFECYKF